MRRLPWRAVQPQDLAADQAKLQARLDKLTGGGATPEAGAPIQPGHTETEPIAQDTVSVSPAAPAEPVVSAAPTSPAPVEPALTATPTSLVLVQPVVIPPLTSLPPRLRDESDRRRRRRFGFLLFFAALIFIFFVVRAIPADWEIGPFRIDASGSAADSAASIYFSDDPHAPFWLLVPTFNLPPRFFAARPNSTARPVALAPTKTPTSTPSGSTSPSTSPSSSASASPSGSATVTVA